MLTPNTQHAFFRAAFTAAEGWGLFLQKRDTKIQRERIEMRWGQLSLKSLAFAVSDNFRPVKVFVTAAGKPVKNDYTLKDGRFEITLKKKLVLSENQILDVTIQQQEK